MSAKGTRRPLFIVQILPLLALMLIAVVGCSGGDDSGSSSTAKSTSSRKPASAPKAESTEPAKPAEETESAAPEKAAAETKTEEPKTSEKAPTESKVAAKANTDAKGTGSFSGTIVLDGAAPELPPLVVAGDEKVKDKEVCGKLGVPNEALVVGEGNGIQHVFVYLRRAPKGHKSDPPKEPVVLDQKGCVFLPHTVLIRAGQQVLVKSSDDIQHNVHTFPARNQSTNLLIKPNEQDGAELVYTKGETDPVQVKCDIHAWMSSYHLVLDHPFMAVTDANGNFSIPDLPPGDYEFRIWHETGGLLERSYKATVTGDDEPVTLKFAADKFQVKT